jgi:2-hydroxychromene-2-carboxylate isomerase
MSLKEVGGDNQHKIIDAIFEGGWCRGEDLGDLPTLVSLLEERAVDGNYLSQQIALPNVKQLLMDETNMAIDLGVFGVPCMIVDGLLFWGNDQMEHIELVLAGKDPLDKNKLDALERPRGIDRKTFSKLD